MTVKYNESNIVHNITIHAVSIHITIHVISKLDRIAPVKHCLKTKKDKTENQKKKIVLTQVSLFPGVWAESGWRWQLQTRSSLYRKCWTATGPMSHACRADNYKSVTTNIAPSVRDYNTDHTPPTTNTMVVNSYLLLWTFPHKKNKTRISETTLQCQTE